jgi:hypothetical protein
VKAVKQGTPTGVDQNARRRAPAGRVRVPVKKIKQKKKKGIKEERKSVG